MLLRPLAASLLAAQVFVLGACSSGESSDQAPAAGGTPAGTIPTGPTPASNGGAGGNAGAGIAGAGGVAGASGVAGSGGGTNPSAAPADESAASLASFLAAKTYQSPSWVAETPAPREGGMGSGSPHDRVRVYFNEVVRGSIAAGNGLLETMVPHTTGSMAVKEIYDSTDTLVGVAAALKLEGNFQRWAYYCYGPDERCALGRGSFTVDAPLYGIAGQVDCGICHGGFVFTAPPN